ncbi:erythrocyte membrane protein 1, PfEMP1 [Plasmodium falciparum 3D7]|uniref:Erythrocyte membrane protein 1, PfEMP1 n=2 Tax=Plasmodium falciparum TaxID=5833 RepID=Q8I218_PLAF7|nr:erythrocyte membrane protein 1, PfEMP1 [Plasmodium falciparum 3D7]PKC48684.1 erythrocyte membrane protein 1 [Plasmodium falciparum NF54]CAD49096.1 erythrocyte membrane protein 1, PfEMP1 [Plasmodium falciparum 3D7]|eukprot:XP_001351321.1 erythrocyte membrane protein 1, PfEMP1 [Plasmodium falciparum 3D7]
MGTGSSTPSVPKDVKNESHNSARNVLENIGIEIYNEEKKKVNGYTSQLRGDLSRARFHDGLRKAARLGVIPGPANSCDLDHKFYTNINNGYPPARNPCDLRNQNRFGENAEAYCNSDKIRVTGKKSAGGACAPFRRQNMCDKNLEYLDNTNTDDTDDLLGNVLVTAKYEGESIVAKHPHKENSEVCTALARSFADIGDIVRGKDMFKRNEEDAVQKGLRAVFKKINDNLKEKEISDYDNDPNYYKLREDWWTANRDQVWRAITCYIPYYVNYFKKTSDDTIVFTNDGKCGHYEGAPPTNLDYVPQFLRWFDEWAEEFCRIRNHKLRKIKDACRNDKERLYCSQNGYDCTKRIEKGSSCSRENKCTGCSNKCVDYDFWLEKQQNEFKIQKDKYDKEIETYVNKTPISNSNSNTKKEYYKEFYEELKKQYGSVKNFLQLLNNGRYCQEKIEEEDAIDFTKTGNKHAFYRSDYCQPCPDCVVECDGKTCTQKTDDDKNCRSKIIQKILESETPIEIEVLYSDDKQGVITEKLKDFCRGPNNYNDENLQKWKCYNKNSEYNKCEMISWLYQDPKEYNLMLSVECFHSWAKNLLIDTIRWEHQLKNCINNTNVTDCTSKCIKNCECYEAWIERKKDEWEKLKEVLNKKDETSHNYYNKLKDVFDRFLFQVMFALDQDEKGKWDQFTEDLKKKFGPSVESAGTANSQDAIEFLLDHLKDNALTCRDNNSIKPCTYPPNPTPNPCGTNNNGGKLVRVKRLAEMMQRRARKQLEKRGGEINLKADASQGKYIRGGKEKKLNGQICNIDTSYSNDSRNGNNGGPCTGKNDKRFKIGTEWSYGEHEKKRTHPEVYMPPRREHMCISNLEKLDVVSVIKNGNASHSLLGDVLLAAKYEAKNIKELYQQNNSKNGVIDQNDKETICRAMKYSFADIGDIIRGKDMWVQNTDATKLQAYLAKIFDKIKDNHKDIKGKLQYNGDTDHKLLREDWWEANRHQVWRAMKCAIENDKDMKCNGIPIEDYIPQRLRWMTEWAEWYCKEQSRLYGELLEKCQSCKGKQKCTEGDVDCGKCKAACDKYKDEINKWREQWTKIKGKYKTLYKKATKPGVTTSNNPKDEKDVVDFLKQLLPRKSKNTPGVTAMTPNTLYSSAAGYIHQELGKTVGCNTQKEFCDNKKGKYAFKHPPKEYEEACICDTRQKAQKPIEKKNDCNGIKTLLDRSNGGTGGIDGCNPKIGNYPSWNCERNESKAENKGACVPPRREKFCVSLLAKEGIFKNKGEDIRETFVKSAALETYFAWKRYNDDNKKAEEELKSGTIPENFKRQMYYTFADYRDIFFGTDITSHDHILDVSKNAKNKLKEKNGEQKSVIIIDDEKLLADWWKEHGHEIWEGMLCALTHEIDEEEKNKIKSTYSYDQLKKTTNGTTPLEKFAERPQFLRWFTEWSDEFCREREKKEEVVEKKCKKDHEGCNKPNTKGNHGCVSACKDYEEYISTKKKQYNTQKEKFDIDKNKGNEEYENYKDKEAHDYLKDKCFPGTCDYMEKVKNNSEYWDKPNKTYTNSDLEKKCECKPQPPPPAPAPTQSACEIVDDILNGKSATDYIEKCNGKYKYGRYPEWNCNSQIHRTHNGACMPPRRQKLCVINLQYFKGKTTVDLREAFIKCAAVETFFLWHKYKEDNNGGEDLQNQLESGIIPDDFKRQMFYTFGDYRDFLFGTDISKGHGIGSELAKKIDSLFKNIGGKNPGDLSRKDWWNENGPYIWKGMLCSLEKAWGKDTIKNKSNYNYHNVKFSDNRNGPDLETFAKRPQFLRWFTEWGDEFCREQKKQLDILKKKCPKETCTNEGKKKECSDACKAYKEWLQTWKEHYEKQKIKYENDKDSYTNDPDTKQSPQAYQYLNKKLEKICPSGNTSANCEYKCMKYPSSQNNNNMPASLDDTPSDYKDTCECTKSQASSRNFSVRSEDGEDGPPPPRAPRQSLARSADNPSPRPAPPGGPQPPSGTPDAGGARAETGPSPQQPPKPPAGNGGVARILQPIARVDQDEEEDEDEEDDDEESGSEEGEGEDVDDSDSSEDENDEEDEDDSHHVDGGHQEEEPPDETEVVEETVAAPEVKPACEIVKELFNDTNKFKDACNLKYGGNNSRLGWKCIPSGDSTTTSSVNGDRSQRHRRAAGEATGKSDASGSICVPPRRRRLYVGKLTQWASQRTQGGTSSQIVGKTASQPNSHPTLSPSSNPRDDGLRDAFIQSAAVETFFLWDRYKKLNTKKPDATLGGLPQIPLAMGAINGYVPSGDDNNPQKKLEEGEIPEEFKRQMFYTLGDYRDILFGKNDIVIGNTGSGASDKEMKAKEEKIKETIDKVFPNSVSTPPPTPATKPSDEKRKTWWEANGEHIWKGMIYALTYKDNGEKKIVKDNEVYKKLWDEANKKPKETKYQYKNVKLEENSGAKPTQPPSPSGDNTPTTLTNFISRPPYFRYLEEWGETFCRERKKRLEEVRKECRGEYPGEKYCGGDGHDCTENGELKHTNMFADLDCRDCHKQCRKYRKWIDIKFEEYEKQKDKYQGELDKLNGNSNGNNNCCKEIKKHTSASEFLKELKHCKDGQNSEDDTDKSEEDKKNNKIDFNKPLETFNPSTYCETCPSNKVNCNGSGRGTRGKDPCTPHNEKGKSWESVFNANGGNSTEITVEMIDRREPLIKNYSKILEESGNSSDSLFKTSRLFKSVRDQQWECRYKDEKTDICKLKNFNDKIDLNQYTTFKVFLEYWLQDFIEGYYILKKRKIIEQCKENGGETCNENSKNDCACVKGWVAQKTTEWNQIKDHYNKKEYGNGYDMSHKVKNYFEKNENELRKWIDNYDVLKNNEEYEVCNNGDKNCNFEGKKRKKDMVTLLLSRLQNEIKTCQNPPPSDANLLSAQNPAQCQESSPVGDVEEDLLLEEENTENTVEAKKNMMPTICKDVVPQEPKAEDESGCKTDAPQPDVKEEEEEKEEEKDKGDEEQSGAPSSPSPSEGTEEPPPAPEAPPSTPRPQPLPSDNTSDILKTTIPFGIALALTSIALLFLKKKPKSPVDLIRVLDVHKGDYGMPTLESKNRYIPYRSGTYKGKTYIYMEGDTSGDDDKYMFLSDTTDITSSESEYEEMDINDIYVPGSPKYKTLIEVVLEPSKSNGNTPSKGDGNTLGDDMIPTTNTFTDEEWNELKHDFISQYIQSRLPMDVPQYDVSTELPMNITEVNVLDVGINEKPFITSIHDRDLYSGEEINYNINMSTNTNNDIPKYVSNNVYSGIDLINDTLSGNKHIDIYDEVLKRKENELFGTNHTKNTSNNSVAKNTNSDSIMNQLDLLHKWLDRRRNMCEKWEKHNKEELLDKLNEQWNKDNDGINVPSDNRSLNTDVSIQIDMDENKGKKEFSNMDTNVDTPTMDNILDDLETCNEPFYDIYEDDIYYDVNDENPSVDDIPMDHNKVDVPKKVHVEMKILNNTSNGSLEPEFPISDVWNI